MKRYIFTLIATLIVSCSSMFAQRYDGTTMMPIYKEALDYIKLLENEHEQEIVRIEFDILRTTKSTYRTLTSDYTYMILAFGDDRFKDIDVKVYRKRGSQWVEVASDNDADNIAVVSVTPTESEQYRIDVVAYSYNDGYDAGHYGLIISHE